MAILRHRHQGPRHGTLSSNFNSPQIYRSVETVPADPQEVLNASSEVLTFEVMFLYYLESAKNLASKMKKTTINTVKIYTIVTVIPVFGVVKVGFQ